MKREFAPVAVANQKRLGTAQGLASSQLDPEKKKPLLIRRGSFTLSELLLAAAFLIFVLASMLILYINCILLNETNRSITRAMSHAQYVMEEIKDTNFININPKITAGDWDWNTSEITSQGLTALRNESIDSDASGTALVDIVVAVNWQDRRGRDRSTSLETLLAEP